MQVFVLAILIIAVVVIASVAVHGYLVSPQRVNSNRLSEIEKAHANERVRSELAQAALREIAAGAEMPVFRATDALAEINKTYTKEINK